MSNEKVTIITGGTRGIGLETARTFAENGATVIIFGSREETVNKALKDLKNISSKVDGYWPNLNSYTDIESTIQKIIEKYGKIDVLINNAGISAGKPIDETTPEEIDQILNLNVRAVLYTAKAVVPYMKQAKNGTILNTSSMVSIYGQPAGVAYPASKFAVNGITKSLSRELAPFGIRVNAVAPGITNTDMVANLPKETIEPLRKSIPLGRIGEPKDIANAFLFLASDMASYITGEILQVDGAARC